MNVASEKIHNAFVLAGPPRALHIFSKSGMLKRADAGLIPWHSRRFNRPGIKS